MPKEYCFVIQPFDGNVFDKRFKDTFQHAIKKAGLIPYRTDKDRTVSIPIEAVEKKIKGARFCFADITLDNPNVWFELGYAMSLNKPILMICCEDERKSAYPFDVQHRTILKYKSGSKSDFDKLKKEITEHIIGKLKTLPINTLEEPSKLGFEILEQRNFIKPNYNELLNKSSNRIWVMGKTLSGFRGEHKDLIRKKSIEGLDIRLLALDLGTEKFHISINGKKISFTEFSDFESGTGENNKNNSLKLYKWVYEENAYLKDQDNKNRVKLKVYNSFPVGALMIIDEFLFFSPTLTFNSNAHNPTIFIKKGNQVFERFEEHFKELWANKTLAHYNTDEVLLFRNGIPKLSELFKRRTYYTDVHKVIQENDSFTNHAQGKLLYNELAPFFQLSCFKDNEEEISFLKSLGRYKPGGIKSIIDMCCGIGRHAKKLTCSDFEVIGVDISKELIKIAGSISDKTVFELGDMRSWKATEPSDLIICMWSAFNYLSTVSDCRSFFDASYNNLKKDGLLLIDVKNPETIPLNEITKNSVSFPFELNLTYKKKIINDNILEVIYNYTIKNVISKETISLEDQEINKIYTLDNIKEMTTSQFEVVNTFGDFKINDVYNQRTSKRMIVLLKKR